MKNIKSKHIVYAVLCIIAGVIVILSYSWNQNISRNTDNLSFSGTYSVDNKSWNEIHDYSLLRHLKTGIVTLNGHFNKNIEKNTDLWMQAGRASITIAKNGNTVFSGKSNLETAEKTPFVFEWLHYKSEDISCDDDITITIHGRNSGIAAADFLESLYAGDKIDLLRINIKSHLWQIFCAILMICAGIAFVLTMLILCFTNNKIYKRYIFSGLFLISGGICTIIDYDYITLLIPSNVIVNNLDYLSQCLICEFLMLYVTAFLQNKILKNLSLSLCIVMIVSVIVCFIIPINMSEYIYIQIPAVICCVIISALFLIYEYFKLKNKKIKTLLVSGVVVSCFIVAEMINFYITDNYWIIVFQFGLLVYSSMQFFYFIHQANDTIKEASTAERIKRELAEAKIDIMLSQIQPHFLFNSLSAIVDLCDDNSNLKKALIDFSKYLRVNIDSIKQNHPQPFEMELQHIKTYLTLEKMRFQEKLNVVYNIRTTDFAVPSLTIQPIVENAVKHGILNKNGIGTLTITTLEEPAYYSIIIADNGIGFDCDSNKNDGKIHTGIENVRHRLLSMCNAELIIESELHKGTKATINIPKEIRNNEITVG